MVKRSTRLMEPFRLGSVDLRNRVVHPSVMRNLATADGYVSERSKASYEAVAKGGAALIITGAVTVDPRGRLAIGQFSIYDDKFVAGLKELAEIIHRWGAKVVLQLHHAGVKAKRDITGTQAIGASKPVDIYVYNELKGVPDKEGPREMTVTEIQRTVALYAKAAERAQKAGFDGVEIQTAGPGFLINQFLNPALNKRRDAYGGGMENRARFLLEVINAVRETVETNFLVWCRINAEWSIDRNASFKEGLELARILRNSRLNALHVSGQPAARSFYSTSGYFVHCAEAIKRASGLPIIAGGGIDVEIGERVLEEERADLVAMARPLIADPELPNKIASERTEEIRPCLGCSNCFDCTYYHHNISGIKCMVNPAFGNEAEYNINRATQKKKVLVIGGGPAGMEAARVAAERGHTVTLYEKAPMLGGQMVLAAIPPNKNRIQKFRDYLEVQMLKAGVRVELSKEVSAAMVEKIDPDAVIVATGSSFLPPKIPGIKCDNVTTFEAVLTGKATIGSKVAVIGGGMIGCEVADFLARKGKSVTIIEMLDVIMPESNPSTVRGALLDILAAEKVALIVGTKAEEITKEGLIVSNKEGERQIINADTIILATGSYSNDGLFKALNGKIQEVFRVGDCSEPRRILEAIDEGFRTALTI